MSDNQSKHPSPLPPLPQAGEGWGEGGGNQPPEGISLVQLALLQRRLRADQAAQIAAAAAKIPVPADGKPGTPPEHQWSGTRLRFQHPDGTWGAWVDLRPNIPDPKAGEPGDPGQPPAHQWSGHRLRFQQPNGAWGAWVDLRPRSAVYAGGGSDWNPDTLPDADDTPPDELIVKQNGAWVRASLAQVRGWIEGVTASAVTIGGVPVTINGVPVVIGGSGGSATPTGGSVRQERFMVAGGGVTINGNPVTINGEPVTISGGSAFTLSAEPLDGVALVSLNGLVQHEYNIAGQTVTLSEPAQSGDDVQITYWVAS